MNELQLRLHEFNGISVRTTEVNGEVWFVAKDVCDVLGYKLFNPNLILNVPPEWKGVKRINTLGGTQEMSVISEQGLYFFLGRSDKKNAMPFQMWVAGTVVPSIRKTGSYSVTQKTMTDAEMELAVFSRLKKTVEDQKKRLAEAEPKADAYDQYVNREGFIELQEAGKRLSERHPQVGPNKIFQFLISKGILYKDRSGYHSFQKHVDAGRFYTDESTKRIDGYLFTKAKTYATSRGMAYMHDLLTAEYGSTQKRLFLTQ